MEAIVGVLAVAIVGGAAVFITRFISPAALNQKAGLGSTNYNPRGQNADPVFTMQEYFRSQVEEERVFRESSIRFGSPI